jgi:hypothetical protein
MIDAKTRIADIGIPKIVPEGIDALAGMYDTQRIRPTLSDNPPIGLAAFRPEQRVIDPTFGFVDIEFGRNDVVVAGEHHRLAGREKCGSMHLETLKPAQLVIEFRSGRRISVRQVEAANDKVVDGSLDVAAMDIVIIPRKDATSLSRFFAAREDGDAIPAFLAVPDHAMAGFPNWLDWESLLRCLQFLQTNDVRLRFSKPAQENREPAIHAVHIEGRQPHGRPTSMRPNARMHPHGRGGTRWR